MSDKVTSAQQELKRLQEIVARLRAPDGCPWDRDQTPQSLIPYLLEEAYEVVETIEQQDMPALQGELGDLLLHIVMQSRMAEEKQKFELADAIKGINEKLIRRHPHVFGDNQLTGQGERELLSSWERAKLAEGRQSRLDGVPAKLPALIRAQRIQDKASLVGFDWEDVHPALNKLHEELDELEEAYGSAQIPDIAEELGDVFFSLVNVTRLMKLDAESILRLAVEKFIDRFKALEKVFRDREIDMEAASLEEMDAVWDEIKHKVDYRRWESKPED